MLNDPFQTGRSAHRLLFDFSIGVSLLNFDHRNMRLLDFACGSGWTSEFLNKLGFDVFGFDIDKNAIETASARDKFDKRINKNRCHYKVMDGHRLKYPDNYFGNVFCFDSLHHMSDYDKVLKEIYRVLDTAGTAVFIEPGSRHSKSKETIAFIEEHVNDDNREFWLERDVNLDEMYRITDEIGFTDFRVKPFLDPSMVSYSYTDWFNILHNKVGIRNYIGELRRFNWEDRVIFSIRK